VAEAQKKEEARLAKIKEEHEKDPRKQEEEAAHAKLLEEADQEQRASIARRLAKIKEEHAEYVKKHEGEAAYKKLLEAEQGQGESAAPRPTYTLFFQKSTANAKTAIANLGADIKPTILECILASWDFRRSFLSGNSAGGSGFQHGSNARFRDF